MYTVEIARHICLKVGCSSKCLIIAYYYIELSRSFIGLIRNQYNLFTFRIDTTIECFMIDLLINIYFLPHWVCNFRNQQKINELIKTWALGETVRFDL